MKVKKGTRHLFYMAIACHTTESVGESVLSPKFDG